MRADFKAGKAAPAECIKQFREDVKAERVALLVCRNCGSAAVDHRSIEELYCCRCNLCTEFDGRGFAVVRLAHLDGDLLRACGGDR